MTAFITGIVVLAVLFLLLQLFIKADPKRLAQVIRIVGGLALGVFGLLISLRGFYFLGGPVAFYGFVMAARGFGWQGMPGLGLPGLGPMSGPSGGQSSGVSTRWLDMKLDHDSGAMDGLIKWGVFRGRRLSELDQDEALELLREVRIEDPDSERLVEAFMDRTWPDWRDDGEDEPSGGTGRKGGGPMTVAEALDILELEGEPSAEEVRQAYKRQMKKHHPDQGGSDADAARLNQARDILLKR